MIIISTLVVGGVANAGDIGKPGNPCWNEFQGDICTDPPPPCIPSEGVDVALSDDVDGTNDGQLVALGYPGSGPGCGTLTVSEDGYYNLYDIELSESCSSQLDETGYLTVSNSCNSEGWAVQSNAGNRFVVPDGDNTDPCGGDGDCGADQVCRDDGSCCTAAGPVFMGTFFLTAAEPNTICLNHWCPDYQEAADQGEDLGFVFDGCNTSIANSIHYRIENSLVCADDLTQHECTWGCSDGTCAADPCLAADCPGFCMDGACLDTNPCDAVECEHGCVNGRCLEDPSSNGEDGDGDGYPAFADCDDSNTQANPGADEQCGNGVDDDCDGDIDEQSCGGNEGEGESEGEGEADGEQASADSGCGCRIGQHPTGLALLLLLGLIGLTTRRRR